MINPFQSSEFLVFSTFVFEIHRLITTKYSHKITFFNNLTRLSNHNVQTMAMLRFHFDPCSPYEVGSDRFLTYSYST